MDDYMRCKLFFAWYDGWIGYFYDRKSKVLYLAIIPMVILKIELEPKP